MATLNNIRIEDDAGNVFYPHTKAEVVFMEDGKNAETVISQFSNLNLLINETFQVWQRGLSINTSPYITYTADRWYVWSALGNTARVEKISKGIKITRLTGNGSIILYQILESDLTTRLKGKDVTVSINLKKGKGILSVNGANNAGSIPIAYTQKDCLKEGIYSSNISIPQDSYAHIAVGFNFSSIAVGETVEIEGIKLELGEIATPLSPRSYGEELDLCQRYCRLINLLMRPAYWYADRPLFVYHLDSPVRIIPNVSIISQIAYFDRSGQTITSTAFNCTVNQLRILPTINSYQDFKEYILEGAYLLDAEIY